MRIKWRNVPISEAPLPGVVSAIVFHILFPLRILDQAWIGHATGWPAIILGILLADWAVVEAGTVDTASPTKLITTGSYAVSRNPLYIAWTAIGLGIALTINTIWLMLFLPVVVLYHIFLSCLKKATSSRNLEMNTVNTPKLCDVNSNWPTRGKEK